MCKISDFLSFEVSIATGGFPLLALINLSDRFPPNPGRS
jgi:hypothetical protein